MFTASPSAEYSTRLPAPIAPTTTGPVWTPTRTPNPVTPHAASTSRAYSAISSTICSDARTARSGSSSCAVGAPNKRQHAVPREVLDRPAERFDRADHARHGVADDDLQLLGIEAFAEHGRADQIGEDRGDHASLFADLAGIVRR